MSSILMGMTVQRFSLTDLFYRFNIQSIDIDEVAKVYI